MTNTPSGGPTGKGLPRGGRVEARSGSETVISENPFLIPPELVTPIIKVKALETFPLTPHFWEARFYRGGSYWDDGNIEAARQLADQGIIPGTTLKIGTSDDSPTVRLLEVSMLNNSEQTRELRALQLGGFLIQDAVQRYEFECKGAYEQFRNRELTLLLVRGYNIYDFELWTSSVRSRSEYSEGSYMTSGLKSTYKGLELAPSDYRGNLPPENTQTLKDWFAGLKAEAMATQQQPQ